MTVTAPNIVSIDFLNAVPIPISIWDSVRKTEVYSNDLYIGSFNKSLSWEQLHSTEVLGTDSTFRIVKKEEGNFATFSFIMVVSNNDFIHLASHDLKEPLRKINTFGDRLTKTLSNKDDKSRLFLDRMMDASQRLTSMLDALLEYSRVKKSEDPTSFYLKEHIQSLADKFDLVLIWVENKINKEVTFEKAAFTGVVNELLSNASKFKRESNSVKISINQVGKNVQVRIEDQGIGIQKNQQTQVLQPFVKLNGRSAYPGNGMGLAIAHKTCLSYGGDLEIEGLETGVKATITWPLV